MGWGGGDESVQRLNNERLSTMHITKQAEGLRLSYHPTDGQCEPVWPSGKALGREAEGSRFDTASALLCL